MKVVMTHPVLNANVRAAATALGEAGLLSEFHTTADMTRYSRIVPIRQVRLTLSRRSLPNELRGSVRSHPRLEVLRLGVRRLGKRAPRHLRESVTIDRVSQSLDAQVARRLVRLEAKAVYAYEDCALRQFEVASQLRLTKLYDLPIGYWREHATILAVERERRPDWASTLTVLKDPPEKLSRKDKELSQADHITVASSFTRSTLRLHPDPTVQDRVTVIPYGFPTPRLRSGDRFNTDISRIKSTGQLNVLYVGALSQRKGIADLVEAVDSMHARVRLTIIGRHTADSRDCQPLLEALSRHEWIETLSQDEVLRRMRSTDVLALPSLFEGFGLVISEAMSQGAAVIATERTAASDLFADGEAGRIVAASQSESIVAALDSFLTRPNDLIAMQQRAQDLAGARPWSSYGADLCTWVASNVP